MECIEKNQSADARSNTSPVENRQGRSKASAVSNDHDRHFGERECALRVPVNSRKLDGRFINETFEPVRLSEFPSA